MDSRSHTGTRKASLLGHIYAAEILLYEIGLQGRQESGSSPYQLVLLGLCLRATKAFLDNRFTYEIREHPVFTSLSSFDFVYAFLTALKLITHQAPGWDLARARQALEFDRFVERQVQDVEFMAERRRRKRWLFFGNWAAGAAPEPPDLGVGLGEGAGAAVAVQGDEDPFLRLAKKMRRLSRIMVSAMEDP